MLRLWPENIVIGLYGENCYLWRDSMTQVFPNSEGCGEDALLGALAEILGNPAARIGKGSRLHLTVTDTNAITQALPWQEDIYRSDEIIRYAKICLADSGIKVDDKWELQAEFTNFGAMGFGFGLRRDWLRRLLALCKRYTIKLASVMPVSARAYSTFQHHRVGQVAMQFLREPTRCAALVYGENGLITYDAEPVTNDTQLSMVRLIRRVAAKCDDKWHVSVWANSPGDQVRCQELLQIQLPTAITSDLHGAWRA